MDIAIVILLSILVLIESFRFILIMRPSSTPAAPARKPENVQYDEEEILGHLDYIITDSIEQWVLLNIIPKEIPYINSKLEDQLRQTIMNEVPDKISPILLEKLGYIYDQAYIGKFLGGYIYMKVTDYVAAYNLNVDENKIKK